MGTRGQKPAGSKKTGGLERLQEFPRMTGGQRFGMGAHIPLKRAKLVKRKAKWE
jgi:hypothetical protein